MAGAGRPPAGTGGGALELEIGGGCVTPRLGPPGDGGDNLKRIIRLQTAYNRFLQHLSVSDTFCQTKGKLQAIKNKKSHCIKSLSEYTT